LGVSIGFILAGNCVALLGFILAGVNPCEFPGFHDGAVDISVLVDDGNASLDV